MRSARRPKNWRKNWWRRRAARACDGSDYIATLTPPTLGRSGRPSCIAPAATHRTPGAEQWRAYLNGRGNNSTTDDARNILLGPDGNPVVFGSSSLLVAGGRRCTAVKYDAATGKELWRNGPSLPAATPAWTEFECFGMAIDSAGNIVMVGRTREQFNFGNADIYVAKMSATGSLLWQQTLANGAYAPAIIAPNTVSASSDDLASFVTVDSSNTVYVAGRTQEGATQFVWAIFKIAATGGSPIWRSNMGGSGDSRVRVVWPLMLAQHKLPWSGAVNQDQATVCLTQAGGDRGREFGRDKQHRFSG